MFTFSKIIFIYPRIKYIHQYHFLLILSKSIPRILPHPKSIPRILILRGVALGRPPGGAANRPSRPRTMAAGAAWNARFANGMGSANVLKTEHFYSAGRMLGPSGTLRNARSISGLAISKCTKRREYLEHRMSVPVS